MPIAFYFLHNNNKDETIIYELGRILEETKDLMISDYMLDKDE